MNEDDKIIEYVENRELDITSVDIETNTNNNTEVRRVIFNVGENRITWKPKVSKEEYKDGLKIISKIPMTIDALPEKLKKIGSICQSMGKCKVKANYTAMTTDNDGQEVTYRYITSPVTLEKWEILPTETKI